MIKEKKGMDDEIEHIFVVDRSASFECRSVMCTANRNN